MWCTHFGGSRRGQILSRARHFIVLHRRRVSDPQLRRRYIVGMLPGPQDGAV
jgi:hypothetical protein